MLDAIEGESVGVRSEVANGTHSQNRVLGSPSEQHRAIVALAQEISRL